LNGWKGKLLSLGGEGNPIKFGFITSTTQLAISFKMHKWIEKHINHIRRFLWQGTQAEKEVIPL